MPSRIVGGSANVAPQLIRPGDVQVADSSFSQAGNFLLKLGERYASGQLAQKQQQMFVDGMQRVATGEALSDIKQDQPAFASIFGDTASIQGAQAMAKVKAVDDFTTQAYGQMPELAKMSPSKAGKVLASGMQQHLTGDAAVDAVIQQRMVEQLPVLMKAQTKANYAYVQNEMSRQYSGSLSSAAQTMQGASLQLARGVISQEDFDVNRSNAVSMLQKPAGMADETYKKTIMETAQLQLSQGNHWYDRTLRQRGPNGEPSFYETVLDADDQKKLIDARVSAEARTAKQYGFNQYGSVIAELAGRAPGMAPAEIQKAVLQINKQYMAETGAESGIIDMNDATAMVKGSYSRSFALQDKAAELRMSQSLKDASDAAKSYAQLQKAIVMSNQGQGKFAMAAGVKQDEFDQVVYEQFQQLGQQAPDKAAALLVRNWGSGGEYINPHVENMLQSPFRQAEAGMPTGQSMVNSQAIYAEMTKLPGGQAAADAYLGKDGVIRMQNYNAAVNEGMSTTDAATFAFSKPILKGQRMDTNEFRPILDKALKEEYQAGGANGWFQTPMYDSSKDILMAQVAPIASEFQANLGLSPEAAIKKALPIARQRYDVLGPLVVTKRPGEPELAQVLGTSREDAGKVAFETIQKEALKQGVNIDIAGMFDRVSNDTASGTMTGRFTPWDALTKSGQVSATRLRDVRDPKTGLMKQVYHATVYTPDGKSADFSFDSDQMKANLEARISKKPSQGGRLNPSVPDYRVK